MTYPFPPDIRELVDRQMSTGEYASEDELLRDALSLFVDEDAELTAIQQAVDAYEAGDMGSPVEDVFDRIQAKHNIALDS